MLAKTATPRGAVRPTRRGLTGATLTVTCQVACVRHVDGGLSGTTLIDHLPYCTRETAPHHARTRQSRGVLAVMV